MLHVAAQGSSRTGWFKPGYVQERRYLQVPKLSAAYQRQPTRRIGGRHGCVWKIAKVRFLSLKERVQERMIIYPPILKTGSKMKRFNPNQILEGHQVSLWRRGQCSKGSMTSWGSVTSWDGVTAAGQYHNRGPTSWDKQASHEGTGSSSLQPGTPRPS